MPHVETRVYFYSPEDKIRPKALTLAYPDWRLREITGEDVESIRKSADFKGVLTKRGLSKRYDMRDKNEKEFEVEFQPNWRIQTPRYYKEQYKEDAVKVADELEKRFGKAPITIVLLA